VEPVWLICPQVPVAVYGTVRASRWAAPVPRRVAPAEPCRYDQHGRRDASKAHGGDHPKSGAARAETTFKEPGTSHGLASPRAPAPSTPSRG